MNRISKRLFILAAALFVISAAMAKFGVDYEISKIPLEQRERMSDIDWIGADWIFRGMFLGMIALMLGVAGLVIWLRDRRLSCSQSAYQKLVKR